MTDKENKSEKNKESNLKSTTEKSNIPKDPAPKIPPPDLSVAMESYDSVIAEKNLKIKSNINK